ncbi:MAG: hypothetical protein LKI76_07830 [Megasphaera sp.]|jgi:hypothetical protein|uniref:hypothetical protein n=1 Tax=Megasphaera sueciensis TaxID=349094 RepID=UPI003D029039|nr:hypothetical protein [Megasphaera sp.]
MNKFTSLELSIIREALTNYNQHLNELFQEGKHYNLRLTAKLQITEALLEKIKTVYVSHHDCIKEV